MVFIIFFAKNHYKSVKLMLENTVCIEKRQFVQKKAQNLLERWEFSLLTEMVFFRYTDFRNFFSGDKPEISMEGFILMEFETVAAIIADQFDRDVEDLTEDTDILDDLNATSMDVVELIVSIESATDVRIPDEIVDTIRTIGDVVNYLAEHAEVPEEE